MQGGSKVDYSNKIYGNIKVLEATTQNKKCTAKCLLCNKIWNPRLDGVVHNRIKSCGCEKVGDSLEGLVFNGISIIEHSGGLQNTAICRCHCGKKYYARAASVKYGGSLSCGCLRKLRGQDHYAWKGGKTKNSDGYVRLRYRDIEGNTVSIFEHRKIMQDHLGRDLRDTEYVHHKNGVRDDNRIENLELWSSSQPPGQRIDDLVKWAFEIIDLYGKK